MSCTTTATICRDFAFEEKVTMLHFQPLIVPKTRSSSGRCLTDRARYGQPTPKPQPAQIFTELTMSPDVMTPRKTPRFERTVQKHARRSTLPGGSKTERPALPLNRRNTDPGVKRAGLGLGISGLTEWEDREAERERELRELRKGRNVNGYTRCGRHSDEWLFGGLSLVGMVKKVVGLKTEDDA